MSQESPNQSFQPTVLEFFWNLASTDSKTRLSAGHALISTLDNFQSKHQSNLKHEKDDVSQLDHLACPDLSYSVKRLVRGLPSARQGARQGFATALAEILHRYPFIKTKWVLDMLQEATQITGSQKGGEERDMYFGKLFGAQAIVESQCLLNPDQTKKEDLTALASSLAEWARTKPYLREPCFSVLIDMFSQLKSKPKLVTNDLVKSVLMEGLVDGPETFWFAAWTYQEFPDLDWSNILPQWKYGNVLHPGNLNRAAETLQHASASHPRLHSVWSVVLPRILSATGKDKHATFTLQDFWMSVCEQRLFTSSHERRYLGMLLLQQLLPQLKPQQVPQIFTPNFIKSLVNNLGDTNNYLHKQAVKTASSLVEAASTNPSLAVPLVTQLNNFNSQFDRITKTRTVEELMQKMDQKTLTEYVDYLKLQFLQQTFVDEEDKKRVENKRQWCIDQMFSLLKNRKLPLGEQGVLSVLKFVFAMAFAEKTKGVAEFQTQPNPPLSDATKAMCKARLSGMFADLIPRDSLAGGEGNFTREMVDYAVEVSDKAMTLMEPVKNARDAAMTTIKKIRKQLKKLLAANPPPRTQVGQNRAFELLFSQMIFQLFIEPGDAMSALAELEACYQRSLEEKPVTPSKRKKDIAPVEEDAPHPVDVLTDLLLSFLSKPSALLRSLSEQVFRVFCDDLTLTSTQLILRALDPRCLGEEVDEVDVDDEEDDEEIEEDGLASDSDESESEDSEGDEEEGDEEESQRLKKQLKAALGDKVLDDDDSDESSLDDEAMEEFDDKLAEIFKQKKLAKAVDKDARQQIIHFKMRVVELFDIFIKKSSTNPVLLDIIIPLLTLAKLTSGSDQQRPLHTKITSLIKNRLNQVKDYPKNVEKSKVHEVLKQVLEIASSPKSSKEIILLAGGSSLLLVKIALYLAKDSQEKEVKSLATMFEQVLSSFLTTKHTNIGIEFFKNLIDRYFNIGWRMGKTLVKGLEDAGEYQVVKGFDILTHLFSRLPNDDSLADTCRDYVKTISKVFRSILTRLDQEEFRDKMNPGRTSQVMKDVTEMAKRTKKLLGDVSGLLILSTDSFKKWNDAWSGKDIVKQLKHLSSTQTKYSSKSLTALQSIFEKE